jgi:hypothetical protein
MKPFRARSLLWLLPAASFAAWPGCSCEAGSDDGLSGSGAGNSSTSTTNGNGGAGGVGGSTGTFDTTSSAPPCVNLECQQVQCGSDPTTTVSGTVYDPSGTLPLYNVIVYVPNSEVEPIDDVLACEQCDAELSGSPLVVALTDTEGRFTLENVPVGNDIPLVMQIGKWRRQITIPSVTQCTDNPLTDPQLTRLAKSRTDGEKAHLPRIALTTGGADPLFCLLRRIGIADEEFGIEGSDARVHFYTGANGSNRFDNGFGASPGATFTSGPNNLWTNGWSNYDIVMMSCEGDEQATFKNGKRANLLNYLDSGGRVFGTHYHYNWLQGDAPAALQQVAQFTSTFNTFDNELVDIDTTFPKGQALADWMSFVDGSSPAGQFRVRDGRRHTTSVSQAARVWVRYLTNTIYFTFNTPLGVPEEEQCGKMVFSDIHVSGAAGSPSAAFPGACNNTPLTEQEKALIFLLFDLSSCITPDDEPPPVPVPQ